MLPVVRGNRKPANIGLDVIFAGKLSFVALRRQKIKSFPLPRPPSRILTFVKIYPFKGVFPRGRAFINLYNRKKTVVKRSFILL